ncbi:SRPBCC family protein [Streptomyces sp. PTM05]|uniref:SRPBCC family protein n=1 Tax=Streptantibioticus parmotrematis TaxID=2873249 RepID=A0ABS7QY08_9ACTN|nr:SRPBCC family protein [Streptantibioticus parmotrematis]MBY8887808.1 SRPBCC family protein [Streptantibioticus parmotrematis]
MPDAVRASRIRLRPRSGRRTAALALALVAGVSGGLTTVPARAAAVAVSAASGSLTCQGQGIDPTARLHYEAATFIKAPLATVWKLHTDIGNWPSWQRPVTGAKRLDPGPLRAGSRFRWTIAAPATPSTPATTLVITSTVRQIRDERCTRWTGPAIGQGLRIDRGAHVWNFTAVDGGVLVRTEESWTGRQIEADPATASRYLYPGLDAWLADLKAAAEARYRSPVSQRPAAVGELTTAGTPRTRGACHVVRPTR